MNCKFQQLGWMKYQCHVHASNQNAKIKLQVLFTKMKAQTILLSPCWELSIEAVKWWEALFFKQRMLRKESLGNNDKGWKCPHLTLIFVTGKGLKTIALHFNSWVWALISHSICHQKKVPFICNIWQKGKQCWCKKWLWILQCIFEGNFMLSF